MKRALVPVADGVEEMEAVIIVDILRRAHWSVVMAAIDKPRIRASRDVVIVADSTWPNVDPDSFDVLAIPGGGPGVEALCADSRILDAVKRCYDRGIILAAICAGPLVLQAAGVLDGRRATCHPSVCSQLKAAEHVDERVVVDGRIITSQAAGTAFEFALAIVREAGDPDAARAISRAVVLGHRSSC